MTDVSTSNATIQVTGDFLGFSPDELFDYWVKPDLLVKWWPREATVDPRMGGHYSYVWPEQNWVLQGDFTIFEPGSRLGFTWSWNHDMGKFGKTQVDLTFEAIDGGTRLNVQHGPWDSSEEAQTERQGVIEGWIHFGMRLAGLGTGEAT